MATSPIPTTDLISSSPIPGPENRTPSPTADIVDQLADAIWHSPPNTPPLSPGKVVFRKPEVDTLDQAEQALKEGRYRAIFSLDGAALADNLLKSSTDPVATLERLANFQLSLIKHNLSHLNLRLDLLNWVDQHFFSKEPQNQIYFASYFGLGRHTLANRRYLLKRSDTLDKTLFWVDLPLSALRPIFDRWMSKPIEYPYYNLIILFLGVQTLDKTSKALYNYLEEKGPKLLSCSIPNASLAKSTATIQGHTCNSVLMDALESPHLTTIEFRLEEEDEQELLSPSGALLCNYLRHKERSEINNSL